MKELGWAIIVLAIVGVALGLSMDASVQEGASIQQVNNLGRMSFQQNTLMTSIGLLPVVAAILYAFHKIQTIKVVFHLVGVADLATASIPLLTEIQTKEGSRKEYYCLS